MTHAVSFLPAARSEVIAAWNWYESQSSGLGIRFLGELDVQVERISRAPRQFPFMFKDVRGAKLRRFPYGPFFRVSEDAVYVIACFHASRDPAIWRGRAGSQ